MIKLIFVLFAMGLLLVPLAAYAQEGGPSRQDIIEANYSGPVFLDAYWTSSSQNGTEVNVSPDDGTSTLAVVLINRGLSDISGITGRLTLPDGFQATGKPAGAPAIATFNQLARIGNPFVLFFDVDVLDTASVGEYTARLSVDYSRFFESGIPRNTQMDVTFRVTGKAIVSVSSGAGETSNQIAAGKIENYAFSISNRGTASITNVVVTVKSPSDSLKILGDSKWTIQRIEQDSKVDLNTKVFAANSLIGNPASFDVTVEHSSNGQSSIETFTLGTYVAGEISVRTYEIEISYIGGIPNILGNLLNEGNTAALFTTIEITEAENLVSDLPPPQYLGDLEANSPLPFSIPMTVDNNSGTGTYPVSLRITYKDNLRETHTIDINTEVQFMPEQQEETSTQNSSAAMVLPVGIGVVAAVAIGGAMTYRRRRKSALKRTFQSGKQDDIESVLDSHIKKEDRK